MYELPKGVKMEILMDAIEDKELDAKIVELEPGAQTDQEDYHDGDEFGYVVEGSVDVYLDGKSTMQLKAIVSIIQQIAYIIEKSREGKGNSTLDTNCLV